MARLALLAAIAVVAVPVDAALATTSPAPAATQELAKLLHTETAWSRPTADSRQVAVVHARRPITHILTVLPVIDHATGADGTSWLRVRLPGRPNQLTGWIARAGTVTSVTPWHVVVDISARRVIAFRSGRQLRSFRAVVGKRSTPTPLGESFVEEPVRLRGDEVGAPYALALSARSEVLQEFAGGPGQIAFHGLRSVGGRLGTAASHGCIRLSTRAITWLAKRIGAGVPITVTR